MDRLLIEGDTCWRRPPAERVALLVDGAAYFTALAGAIERAERSILMLGWDFHSRTRLRRDPDGDPLADELRHRLDAAVRRRRSLRVHLLGWDYAPLFAFDREALPALRFEASSRRRICFRLDDRHPVGGSHHQKLVVVDDKLAFCGGLDVTACRWDTPEHRADDPRREDPGYGPYPPFHDVQMAVDGEAARCLGELARERWRRATGRRVPAVRTSGDPWPRDLPVDLERVEVGIARTLPALSPAQPAVREVERLYVASLRAARRTIYLENQYVTSAAIADALVERLRAADGPEVVIVSLYRCTGWLEQLTMGVLRARLLRRLREADRHGRLRVFHPKLPGVDDCDLSMHAKVAIVDDRLLRIGSANLSNRSMGLDTECDLAIEAHADDDVARAIARFRARLLAEHLGCAIEDVQREHAERKSLVAAIDALRGGVRTLAPIEEEVPAWLDELVPEAAVIDPERPTPIDTVARDLGWDDVRDSRAWLGVASGFAVFAVAAVLSSVGPLREWADPEMLHALLARLRAEPWGPLAGACAFALGGLAMLPVTAMTALAGLVYGWTLGAATALFGSLLAGSAGYAVGRVLGRDALRRVAGLRLARLSRALSRRGLLAVVLVRLLPVAPFTVVNLTAGATRVPFRDFALGTLLAMTPGALLLALFADRTARALRDPELVHVLPAALAAALLLGGAILLRRRLVL